MKARASACSARGRSIRSATSRNIGTPIPHSNGSLISAAVVRHDPHPSGVMPRSGILKKLPTFKTLRLRVWGADGRAAWHRRHLVMWCVVLAVGCGGDDRGDLLISPTAPTSVAPADADATALAIALSPDSESTTAGSALGGYTLTATGGGS